MWRYSLTPGLISFGPTRVFGGVTGNKVVEFSVKDAAYTWERYAVVINYKWNRYEIGYTEVLTYKDSVMGQMPYRDQHLVDPKCVLTFARSNGIPDDGVLYESTTTLSDIVTISRTNYNNTEDFLKAVDEAGFLGSYITSIDVDWVYIIDGDYYENGEGLKSTSVDTSPVDSFDQIDAFEYSGDELTYYSYMHHQIWSDKYVQVEQRGDYMDQVTSTSSGAYPSNGIAGNYWYVSAGSSTNRGNYIDDVTSQNYNQYPDNGISGSYWYIRK